MKLLDIKNIPVIFDKNRNNFLWPLQNELNKLILGFNDWPSISNYSNDDFENIPLRPLVDIVEDKDQFKVEVEIPGMGEEDIKVSIDNDILMIKGEKTISRQDENKSYRMREISYGCYERSIALPESLDIDKATASFKKGMLWVSIPKKPEYVKKSHAIEVKKID